MAKFCVNHPQNQAVAFCVKCGTPMCPACEVPIEGRPFCRMCVDVKKREQLIQRIESLQPTEETVRKVKGVIRLPFRNKELRRIIANLIDLAVACLGALMVAPALYGLSHLLMPVVHGFSFGLAYWFTLILVGPVYYFVTHWRWGKTLGKHMLGLRVVRTDGKPLTVTNTFWRLTGLLAVFIWAAAGWKLAGYIFAIVAKMKTVEGVSGKGQVLMFLQALAVVIAVFLSLGVLITFVGKYKRGFHDIIGNSIVKSDGWDASPRMIEPSDQG